MNDKDEQDFCKHMKLCYDQFGHNTEICAGFDSAPHRASKLHARLMDQQRIGGAATIDDLLDVLELLIEGMQKAEEGHLKTCRKMVEQLRDENKPWIPSSRLPGYEERINAEGHLETRRADPFSNPSEQLRTMTCKYCNHPIEMRDGTWRHVMYHGAYCTKPAAPQETA